MTSDAAPRCADPLDSDLDVGWVDEFVRRVKPHIRVRREDDLLILLPNQAYKLNASGLAILEAMLSGQTSRTVLARIGDRPEVRRSLHHFFCDLRALVVGCLGEGQFRHAVEVIPFARPFNALPVLSEIALTYRCNLRCVFCYAGCNAVCRSVPWQEMDGQEMGKVLRIIAREAQVPSVSLTGGEPMLRQDACWIVSQAKDEGLRVNLITNGTLIDPQAARNLAQAGLFSAQVSLEGQRPEIHEALTRVPGSFHDTLSGIRNLIDAGIATHINTTLCRSNIGEIEGMVDLARSLSLPRLTMNLIIPTGTAAAEGRHEWVYYRELPEILTRVKRHARSAGVQFIWYSPTPYCIFNPVAEGLGSKSCAACDGLLSVAPDGSVLPCSSCDEPVGHLLSEPFLTLWSSPRAAGWRRGDHIQPKCRTCEVVEICSGACPLYWESVGASELTQAIEASQAEAHVAIAPSVKD